MKTTQVRAPMLPLLLGLILGLVLAKHFDISLHLFLIFALIGSLVTILLSCFASLHRLWMPGFLISTTLCFWTYGQFYFPSTPSKTDLELPEREARLLVEVQTVMQPIDRYGKTSCVARVLQAPENSRLIPGYRLYTKLPHTIESDLAGRTVVTVQSGLHIEATGVLTPIANGNPGDDFNAYLKDIGAHYRFGRTNNIKVVRLPTNFSQFCISINKRFQKTLSLGTPVAQPELANIYITMLLGRKAELTEAQSKRYRITGTMHFFAISGLHIGVIATVIARFLHLIRIPNSLAPLIGLPFLYFYIEITGSSPSAVRAFFMTAFFWASFAFNRQHTSFSALVSSAIVVLVINPNQLWSLGFQLSYTVASSILLFGLPLHQVLKKRFEPYRWLPEDNWTVRHKMSALLLEKFFQLFAISLSAWLASTPFCAVFFDFISPGTIILNMLLVYPVAVVIISGILSLVCSVVQLSILSEFINHSAWFAIYIMDRIAIFGTYLPSVTLSGKYFPRSFSYCILTFYFTVLFCLHYHSGKTNYYLGLPVVVILSGLCIGICFFY